MELWIVVVDVIIKILDLIRRLLRLEERGK